MKKFVLVDDLDRITKRWSVKIIKLGAGAFTAWGALTAAGLASTVPPWVPQLIAGAGFLGALLAAYTAQPSLSETPKADDAT